MTAQEYKDTYGPTLRLSFDEAHTHQKRVKLPFWEWRYVYDHGLREWSWVTHKTLSIPCKSRVGVLKVPRIELERTDMSIRIVASTYIYCEEPSVKDANNPALMYSAMEIMDYAVV